MFALLESPQELHIEVHRLDNRHLALEIHLRPRLHEADAAAGPATLRPIMLQDSVHAADRLNTR